MKARRVAMIFTLLAAASGAAQVSTLARNLEIVQDGQTVAPIHGSYTIRNAPFQIVVHNLSKEVAVQIFAYHTDEYFTRYTLPVATEETEMFHPATGMAPVYDPETKDFRLVMDQPHTHNYIHWERRIQQGNDATIRIAQIADPGNHLKPGGLVYVTLYTDVNDNDLMEPDEIAQMVWDLEETADNRLTPIRAYVSTLGFKAYITSSTMFPSTYSLVRITSAKEAARFQDALRQTTRFADGVINVPPLDFSAVNAYYLFSPVTTSLQIDQPYHIGGEDTLVFDVLPSQDDTRRYVWVRLYSVQKEDDTLRIVVSDGGSRIEPRALSW